VLKHMLVHELAPALPGIIRMDSVIVYMTIALLRK